MYFGNFLVTSLASGITDSATSMTITTGDGADFGTELARLWGSEKFSYYLTIFSKDYASASLDTSREIVEVTARSTDTFTIARGKRGTSASAHSSGDTVILAISADDLADYHAVGASVTLSSGQTVTHNTTEQIEFDQEDFDHGSIFNTTTHEATLPVDGVYAISVQTASSEADDCASYLYIYKNSSEIARGAFRGKASQNTNSVYVEELCSEDDVIDFGQYYYNYTDSGNVKIESATNRTFATIRLLYRT